LRNLTHILSTSAQVKSSVFSRHLPCNHSIFVILLQPCCLSWYQPAYRHYHICAHSFSLSYSPTTSADKYFDSPTSFFLHQSREMHNSGTPLPWPELHTLTLSSGQFIIDLVTWHGTLCNLLSMPSNLSLRTLLLDRVAVEEHDPKVYQIIGHLATRCTKCLLTTSFSYQTVCGMRLSRAPSRCKFDDFAPAYKHLNLKIKPLHTNANWKEL
jgi:hypothetical protein